MDTVFRKEQQPMTPGQNPNSEELQFDSDSTSLCSDKCSRCTLQVTWSQRWSQERSDEIPHRPQIFNILLTANRTGAIVCVYAINSI